MDIGNRQLAESVQVDEQDILHFEQGIPGFEDVKEYVLVEESDVPLVMTLQSIAGEHPSFVVIDPFSFVEGYAPELSEADLSYFGKQTAENLKLLVIAVLTSKLEDAVVNLKSPIVIDPETNRAKQVIVENPGYPIRYFLFRDRV